MLWRLKIKKMAEDDKKVSPEDLACEFYKVSNVKELVEPFIIFQVVTMKVLSSGTNSEKMSCVVSSGPRKKLKKKTKNSQ